MLPFFQNKAAIFRGEYMIEGLENVLYIRISGFLICVFAGGSKSEAL
jgi:hypothetical protein